jgi:hypothetical protein
MTPRKKSGRCNLSAFEKKLYCSKKRADDGCLKPSFLENRCPYLVMDKKELIKKAKTGAKEIVCLGGFTKEAVEYVERFRPKIRLKDRYTIVKPRRRIKTVAS